MKKFYYPSLLLLTLCATPVFSNTLSPQQALERLEREGYNPILNTRSADKTDAYRHVYTLDAPDKEAALYVFQNDMTEGFLVTGADDVAPALLGYSDHGVFDASNIPPQLKYWLEEYGRQIEFLRKSNYKMNNTRSDSPLNGMPAISPLIKTKWNQGSPYNKYCFTISPDGKESQSVTGCVATSMAQVMYYFQYPEIGHGEISYKFDDSGTYTMNFGSQPFQWDEMLTTYYPGSYNADEEDAVAYLMKACGYSVKMDYGKGESGANGSEIASALTQYFGYSEGINIQTRKFRTYEEWAEMIYENLSKVGPVVYNGSALDGGHSFICDGYDGNGYFHLNWGWGGMSDGYYLLDALNPDEFGIGGAAGGYNLGQQIILGISPDNSADISRQVMQFGSVTGKITDNVLSLSLTGSETGLQYIDPDPVTITFGVMVTNISDSSEPVQYFESSKKNLEAKQGSYFHWDEDGTDVDLTKVNMTEGDSYDFIIATYITAGDYSEWTEACAMPGKYNYVTIMKTSEGYQLENYTPWDLSVEDFKVETSTIYYDMPVKFSAVFSNPGTQSLTRNYSAVLFDSSGKESYKMENYSVNVDASSSLSQTWTSVQWYKENGSEGVTEATEFTLKLYDNWEGVYVDGIEETVTVLPKPDNTAKIESELTIVGAQKDGDVYIIEGNEFEANLLVKVLEGTLNQTLMLAIQMPLSSGDYYTVFHKHFDAIPDLYAGEEQVFNISVIFDDAEPDKDYRIEVWGPDGGFNEKMMVRFDLSNQGVSSLSSDGAGKYSIYSVDGRKIYVGTDSNVVTTLDRGIYIINGKKVMVK
ncbi:MAG: C10 family peptidase [Muribaculaceae bacterium]|nr:C10 family peptidase [Muribaculaceae bacterium]